MLEIASASLVLDPRFNGPPGTANGGYASGAVGELVDGPAEVSLLSPPPLGIPLDVSFYEHGEVDVSHDGAIVARARPVDQVDVEPPVRPTLAQAREASRRHPGHGRATLFSDCYVCGSQRHDGLGIHFGPLRGHSDVNAAVFLPDGTVPNRDGIVAPDMVWARARLPELHAVAVAARPPEPARAARGRAARLRRGRRAGDRARLAPRQRGPQAPHRVGAAEHGRRRARARPCAVDHAGGHATLT